ncbi:MAG: ATP-binding cassette domain-containing protein [Bacilli bacterium]|nr:ATP-binding cassette domain-containing protein [Bacilli bacterium]
MELAFKDYNYKNHKLSFTIKEKEINGITGNHLEEIISMIRLQRDIHNIFVNKKELKDKTLKAKIAFVRERIEESIHEQTVGDQMIEYLKREDIYPKNVLKKLKDALKIVGLKEDVLVRNIYSLSTSEQKLVQISLELLCNPEIIILEEPMKVLDGKNQKKIMMVLKRLKEEYGKAIVIISQDPELLYQETDHAIIYHNHQILLEGKTTEIYQKTDIFRKNKLPLPEIIEFIEMARKHQKIEYVRDIRDLIKDIYKHV